MSRVFLDTNILVYSIDNASPAKRDRARGLLRDLQPGSVGVVSTQVLQEFYVVATRKLAVDPAVARDIVRMLANFEVVVVTVPIIERAIDSSIADHISFWDALIIAGAENAGCDVIWTEDLGHGQVIRGVRIVNPFAVAP